MTPQPPVSGAQLISTALAWRKKEIALASACGMSVNELHCFLQIYLERPSCVRRLCERLGIGGPSTSKLLRSLDRRGLVERTLDPSDRRREIVTLTERGERFAVHVLRLAEALVGKEEYPTPQGAASSEKVLTQ